MLSSSGFVNVASRVVRLGSSGWFEVDESEWETTQEGRRS